MAEKIKFELVSPERLLLDQNVDMVVVPGSEGQFGVLAGHTPMISAVKPGVIDVHDGGQITARIFVSGGFAEVVPERVTVLAEDAQPVGEIDRTKVEGRIRDLESDLSAADGVAKAPIQARLDVERARLAAAVVH